MTCAACAKAVERVTKKLDGVEKSNVNIATEKASIEYDSSKVKVSDIKSVIEKAGYSIIEENNKNQSNINNTCKIDKNKILKEVKEKVKEENIGDDENDYGWRNLKNKIFSKFKRSDKE